MRRIACLLGLLAFLYLPARAQGIPKVEVFARAQGIPKVEVFGGYSYARLDAAPSNINANGWNAALTAKPSKWLGLTADFSGHYSSDIGPDGRLYTFLFGPQLSLPAPVSPFAHALVGGARVSVTGFSDTTFTTALGGGIDVKAAPFLAYRMFEIDYLATHFGGTTQNDTRVSSGIVIRF